MQEPCNVMCPTPHSYSGSPAILYTHRETQQLSDIVCDCAFAAFFVGGLLCRPRSEEPHVLRLSLDMAKLRSLYAMWRAPVLRDSEHDRQSFVGEKYASYGPAGSPICILADVAAALSVNLSGGALFAM